MGIGWTVVKLLVAYEGGMTIRENAERHKYYNQARQYADSVGKPLLVVGMKRFFWQPPNGDITVDIDPEVQNIPGGVWSDEREMPFEDKTFGAVYNAHTLEHLPTVEDVEIAVNECLRIADIGVFLAPSPYSMIANMFCPAHHLRLWFDQTNNRIRVTDNRWRTGIGIQSGDTSHQPPTVVEQSLVTGEVPEIIEIGKNGSAYFLRRW